MERLTEEQVTSKPQNHILTNANVWSADSRWIVYDTRSDPAGTEFDGQTIEVIDVNSGAVRELYRSKRGACCGVATFNPTANEVAFILGPEDPSDDWQYAPWHRRGVIVKIDRPGEAIPLDACDVDPPFTPGALRGGSHVHVFSGDGEWVSFTYEDHLLAELDRHSATGHDFNQRNVGVTVRGRAVTPQGSHPRNHEGTGFSVLVTRTTNSPRPGSDEISRAFEEAWVGTRGYARADGTWQTRAVAFQGNVVTSQGATITEVFIADIPDDVTIPGDGPLAGTPRMRPHPPRGTVQRRLTFTADRNHPGLQGPRHWLRSSPDGAQIAFLMRDDAGTVQIWTVSPNGGKPRQITRGSFDVASALSWNPNGRQIAYIADNSVFVVDVRWGESRRLTVRSDDARSPRPEACVFSPDGRWIAYVRRIEASGEEYNQIFRVASAEIE